MKKKLIILMAASLFAASVPAMAMEHGEAKTQQQKEQCQKDCDMLMKNCLHEVDSIQQRIQKLQQAVRNDGNTYTRDQLNKLKLDLENAQKTLTNLERGGA